MVKINKTLFYFQEDLVVRVAPVAQAAAVDTTPERPAAPALPVAPDTQVDLVSLAVYTIEFFFYI